MGKGTEVADSFEKKIRLKLKIKKIELGKNPR